MRGKQKKFPLCRITASGTIEYFDKDLALSHLKLLRNRVIKLPDLSSGPAITDKPQFIDIKSALEGSDNLFNQRQLDRTYALKKEYRKIIEILKTNEKNGVKLIQSQLHREYNNKRPQGCKEISLPQFFRYITELKELKFIEYEKRPKRIILSKEFSGLL